MPKKSLTAASVERMKVPKSGQVEYFDAGYPGLSLRVSYGGRKAWSMFYRYGGKLNRLSLGIYPAMSLAEAREAWREARKSVTRGIDPAGTKGAARPSTIFSAVVTEWLQRDQSGNRSVESVTRLVHRELIPVWDNRPIQEIGRREILDLIDSITDRGSPVMANRTHACLHRIFNWAIGRGIITTHPMIGLSKQKETSRDRVLSDDELVKVWKAADAELAYPFGDAIRLLILTGARREEIGQLRWSEIDGDTIHLEGARTKNGERHDIPLSAPARALLEGLPKMSECDFVFSSFGTKPIAAWGIAKERLDAIVQIEPWRIHDLRRTVATGLQRLGIGLQVVESVLGHTSGSRAGIIGIYQRHTYANEKRMALEAWGAHVAGLIAGPTATNVVPLRSVS
jgi:integrase